MPNTILSTNQIIDLVSDVITPLFAGERTMVMPFDKNRHENDGEHSLALGLLAGALADQINPSLDTGKITEYAMVHNIVKIHSGDVTVWESDEVVKRKATDETLAADRILNDFPMFPWIIRKYREYELHDTPEKLFVHALDKIYPHILIVIGDYHPVRPTWSAYKRTEEVARAKILESFPTLLPLFDDLCTTFRQRPHFFSDSIPSDEQR
jgi:5'-deoxynucleotidase YfbR-like HD superfamily hydrolase